LSYNEPISAIRSGRLSQQAQGSALIANLGLCGNTTGLSPCGMSGKSTDHREKVFIGVTLGICCLLFLVISIAVILALRWRNKEFDEEIKSLVKQEQSKSIMWGREGKFTFNDIAKATNDCSEKYCIGRAGSGAFTGPNWPAAKSLPSKSSTYRDRVMSLRSTTRVSRTYIISFASTFQYMLVSTMTFEATWCL